MSDYVKSLQPHHHHPPGAHITKAETFSVLLDLGLNLSQMRQIIAAWKKVGSVRLETSSGTIASFIIRLEVEQTWHSGQNVEQELVRACQSLLG